MRRKPRKDKTSSPTEGRTGWWVEHCPPGGRATSGGLWGEVRPPNLIATISYVLGRQKIWQCNSLFKAWSPHTHETFALQHPGSGKGQAWWWWWWQPRVAPTSLKEGRVPFVSALKHSPVHQSPCATSWGASKLHSAYSWWTGWSKGPWSWLPILSSPWQFSHPSPLAVLCMSLWECWIDQVWIPLSYISCFLLYA